MHGVGHLVVHDITGACTQLADLIRDQIGHAGQQVFLQAVHDLLGRPAAVHTLLCIGGCIVGNAAHLAHELRVIHQLLPDLVLDLFQRGFAQLGLEELCVGLILHELIHSQIQSIVHQRVCQLLPSLFISVRHDLLHQLEHHVADDLRIVVSRIFARDSFVNRTVHRVVEYLLDASLRGIAALHVACQLVHYVYNGIF